MKNPNVSIKTAFVSLMAVAFIAWSTVGSQGIASSLDWASRGIYGIIDGDRPGEGDTGRAAIGEFNDPASFGIAGMPRLAQHLDNLACQGMVGMGDQDMSHIL